MRKAVDEQSYSFGVSNQYHDAVLCLQSPAGEPIIHQTRLVRMTTDVIETERGSGATVRNTMEMADLEVARIEAVRLFGNTIANEAEDFWYTLDLRMSVLDGSGLLLFQLQAIDVESAATQRSFRM